MAAPNKIRIIGGRWKRTPIAVVDSEQLRPTPDRVRETLFNWIGPSIAGCAVLDLFAGTGALGFEAASRGAVSVCLVERDARVMQAIRALKLRLSADVIETHALDADRAVEQFKRAGRRFDLIFLDPPFHANWLARIVPRLEALLTDRARIYLESESALSIADLQAWLTKPVVTGVKSDRAGQVYYHLFTLEPPISASA